MTRTLRAPRSLTQIAKIAAQYERVLLTFRGQKALGKADTP